MTLQWTLISYFLYIEIILVIALLIPFIPGAAWHALFNIRLIKWFNSNAGKYFKIILGILTLFFFESIREMFKYKNILEILSHDNYHHHGSNAINLAKEFRAQRNLYITGSSILLYFVINRLFSLITAKELKKA